MKQYLNFIVSLFLAVTSAQPAFAQTKVDGSLLKGDVIGGTASNNRRIVVPKDTKANLDAKTRLEANLVYGTDTKKAYIDNGTSLVAVGSGSGGAVNLITDGDAENAISSIFVPYNDGGVAFPIDGTGGSPTVTTSITSTNPLTGAKSYLLTKPASVVQGQGWSIPFTVDPSYRAKVLKISVDYIVNSGTFTAGSSLVYSDIIWYVYDVTNSTLIEPSSTKMLSNSSTLSDKFEATFQTSATGSSYRLIAHMATGFSTAFELKVDNVTVSPSAYVYGTPVTDWVSYTTGCSGAWVTNTTYSCKKRRVGDEYEYMVKVLLSGAPNATGLIINLPDTIDTTKLTSTTQYASAFESSGNALDAGVGGFAAKVLYYTSTQVAITNAATSVSQAIFTNLVPFTFATSDEINVRFTLPIQGWSSSVQMSDQTDTRVVAASYYGHNSANFADNTYTTIQFNTKLEDTHSMFSAGTTTIKVAGLYEINAAAAFVIGGYGANNIFNLRVRVNGATDYLLDRLINNSSVQPNVTKGSIRLPLKVGDTIVVQAMKTNFGGNSGFDPDLTQTRMSIVRVSGPSAIAASESINARYSTTSTTAITSTPAAITYGTKSFDSHNAMSGSSYTAPIGGIYTVYGSAQLASASWSTGVLGMDLYVNGSFSTTIAYFTQGTASAGSSTMTAIGSAPVKLLAGDVLTWRVSQTQTASINLSGSADFNWIGITKVGN